MKFHIEKQQLISQIHNYLAYLIKFHVNFTSKINKTTVYNKVQITDTKLNLHFHSNVQKIHPTTDNVGTFGEKTLCIQNKNRNVI